MFCPNCGKPLGDNTRFCPNCGTPNSEFQEPAQQPQQAQPVQQPQQFQPAQPMPQQPISGAGTVAVKAAKAGFSFGKLFLILTVVAVIVVAAVYFDVGNLIKSDETLIAERVQALEDAYNTADMDAVLDCFDKKTRAALDFAYGLADGFASDLGGLGLDDIMSIGGVFLASDTFNVDIVKIQKDGKKAMVTLRLHADVDIMDMEHTETVEIPMIKEGTDWYFGGIMDHVKDLIP